MPLHRTLTAQSPRAEDPSVSHVDAGARPAGRGPVLVAVLAWLVLAVAVPLTLVDWSRGRGTTANVVLALLLVAVCAARLAQAIGLDRREMARSMFYVFVYVFLAVPALAQLVADRYPLDGLTYGAPVVSSGLLHVLLGVLAFEVGWLFLRRRRVPVGGDGAARRDTARLSFSPLRSAVIGVIGLGFVSAQIARSGLAAFFVSRDDTTAALTGVRDGQLPYYMTQNKASGLLMIFLSQALVFVALFAILYARRHHLWPTPTGWRLAAWRVLVAALVVANLVMNNPIGNGRFWFGLVIAAFISIYLPFDRPNSQRVYVGSALVILFFAFASLDLFRYAGSSLEVSAPGTTFVQNPSYAMFQMELNAGQYVERAGHTDGHQMLGYVFNFVPRAWWPDKAIPTGQLVDPPLARSTTVWSEFYVDFGVIGIFVLFALYGWASRVLTERGTGAAPGFLHAVLPIVAVSQLFFLRGSLLPVLGVLYQLAAVFVCLLARPRRARDDPREDGSPARAGAGPG